ncbi:alpha/beta hydrolase domain-containing protein [Blastococcus sp. URHD0036]|uniref:alpha/beta hydrolase domain-containing protein n=1 Tax=Blastococcus sp. URHD0036 TaxID=1380356 RepID=UPI00068E9CF3|nr:alpha/beta hydrolase domain-containing protein [Blastococcus sp. URHD0036]
MSFDSGLTVEGPVPGAAYGAPPADVVAEHGYVCEEFFVEGLATAYTHAGEDRPTPDGRWTAVPTAQADFTTRILVVRPRDPALFSGTVFLAWQNVSAGYEQPAPADGEIYRGHAWVGVSAQQAGFYGAGMGLQQRSGAPLLDADPERYGQLHHPGDLGCFDLFSAAASVVGPRRDLAGVDPMGGLPVARVIATGGSQSAMRLCAYADAVHPLHRVVDGFLLSVWEGRAPRLDDGATPMPLRTTVRDDLDVPVLIVNSEFEVTATHGLDLADTDRRRVWEVTGTGHGTRRRPLPQEPGTWETNPVTWRPVHEAGLRAVHRWVAGGQAPPVQPRIALREEGWLSVSRGKDGNGLGGVRLPEIAVPVAEHRGNKGGTGSAALYGGRRRYPADVVRARYGSRAEYLAQWTAAVESMVEAGTLLPEDAPAMLARGEELAASVPLT